MLLMVDDDRFCIDEGETITTKSIRFRTLGCYPLTGAMESDASDVAEIIVELAKERVSERQGRAIDSDTPSAMETKKIEGYF